MPTMQRRLARFSNTVKMRMGLPALWVSHTELQVTTTDAGYMVKSTLLNLTGCRLAVGVELAAYDQFGYFSFENSPHLRLLSSDQLMDYSGFGRHPDYKRGIVLQPYDEVGVEILEVSKPDGSLSVHNVHGKAVLPAVKNCSLHIKVAGGGVPHRFIVRVESYEGGNHVLVRQGPSLHVAGRLLELPLSDEKSVAADKPTNVEKGKAACDTSYGKPFPIDLAATSN